MTNTAELNYILSIKIADNREATVAFGNLPDRRLTPQESRLIKSALRNELVRVERTTDYPDGQGRHGLKQGKSRL